MTLDQPVAGPRVRRVGHLLESLHPPEHLRSAALPWARLPQPKYDWHAVAGLGDGSATLPSQGFISGNGQLFTNQYSTYNIIISCISFRGNSPGPIYRFCGAALAIVRFAAFPETICATHYGNCWQPDFSQFRIYVIFNGNGRPKKTGLPVEEGPCGFEPTTLEGIIGKLRV